MATFYAIIALCLFGGAVAHIDHLGSCPVVETMQDFKIFPYMGEWYENARYFKLAEFGASCVIANYTHDENNKILMINNYKNLLGIKSSIQAVARIPDESEASKMKVKYDLMPFDIEGDYWVLGTDYKSFAVVYSCKTLIFTHAKRAWILTREQDPSETVLAEAYAVVDAANLDRSSFIKTKQTDCE